MKNLEGAARFPAIRGASAGARRGMHQTWCKNAGVRGIGGAPRPAAISKRQGRGRTRDTPEMRRECRMLKRVQGACGKARPKAGPKARPKARQGPRQGRARRRRPANQGRGQRRQLPHHDEQCSIGAVSSTRPVCGPRSRPHGARTGTTGTIVCTACSMSVGPGRSHGLRATARRT